MLHNNIKNEGWVIGLNVGYLLITIRHVARINADVRYPNPSKELLTIFEAFMCSNKHVFYTYQNSKRQWFLTGVPQDPWVP